MSAFAVINTCVGCGACIATCPEHAFRAVRPARVGDPPLVVLASRCTGCGECAEVCPVDACVERTTEPGGS
jgi:electron transport complex protein RnfB